MAFITGLLFIRKQWDSAQVSSVFEIAPNQLPSERRGKNCFGIVAIMGRDGLHLVSLPARFIAGVFDPSQAAVTNDNAGLVSRGGTQAVHNRVDHITMSGKKFAPRRGDLDADLVVRRN